MNFEHFSCAGIGLFDGCRMPSHGIAGTVVKRKKGAVLADLAHPGDEVLVARGGQGGVSTH